MNTDKRKQHYIPKFQLRYFSNNGKQIGVYSIASSQFIRKAAIRDQGKKKFYYGNDGKLENILSNLESGISKAFKSIVASKTTPAKGSEEHLIILAHIAFSDIRNPISIELYKGMPNSLNTALNEEYSENENSVVIPEINHSKAIKLSFGMIEPIIETIADLNFKVIVNKTNTPFITSDNPVTKYNLLFEMLSIKHLNTGYATKGLMLFFPLNPEIAMMFYDRESYKIGNRKDKTLDLLNEEEINQLNMLQLLNSYKCIYFNEQIEEVYVNQLHEKSKKFHKANNAKVDMNYLLKPNEIKESKKYKDLLIMSNSISMINMQIQGVKIKRNAKYNVRTDRTQIRPHPQKIMKNRNI